ncbi:hypothetical protein AAC387_Pa03g3180 [Persea americana]
MFNEVVPSSHSHGYYLSDVLPLLYFHEQHFGDMAISRINKAHRSTAVLDNEEEGEKYAQHSLRKFLRQRPPEVMPAINEFFSNNK